MTDTNDNDNSDIVEPTLTNDAHLNGFGEPNNGHSEQNNDQTETPAIDASKTPLTVDQEVSNPGSDGRKGLFKTLLDRPREVHAIVVGGAIGAMAAQTGDFSTIAAIIGAGALGSRAQLGLPETYLKQAKAELPYAIAGIVIGYALVRFGPGLAGVGV